MSTDGMRAEVTASGGPVLLVVRENHAPGWTASIDGAPAEVVFVDHALRGVWVPAGRHDVTMAYVPAGLRSGLQLTAAGLLALCAMAFAPVARGWGRRVPFGRASTST